MAAPNENSTVSSASAGTSRPSADILPDSIPLSVLLECHPNYNPLVSTPSGKKIGILQKCGDIYEGGERFEKNKSQYLNPREQDALNKSFAKARLACASHSEDASSIIDWHAGNIFTESPTIESADEYLASLSEDVDGTGLDFSAQTLDVAVQLLIYGRAYVAADFPGGAPDGASLQTANDSGANDGRICTYNAEHVDDWAEDERGNLVWIRVHTVTPTRDAFGQAKTEKHCWTYLTSTGRRDYEATKKIDKDWSTDEKKSRVNGLPPQPYNYNGKLPVSRVRIPGGMWLMNRLATASLNLFNAEAGLEFLYMANCYQMLVLTLEGGSAGAPRPVGELTGFMMRIGESANWLAPASGPFAEYREYVKVKRDKLYAAAQALPLLAPAQVQNPRQGLGAKITDHAAAKTMISTYRGAIKDAFEYVLDIIKTVRGAGDYEIKGLDEKEPEPVIEGAPSKSANDSLQAMSTQDSHTVTQ